MRWSNRIALVLLCAVALVSAKAYAGGGDTPSGEPPFGVAFMSKAKGTKLTGVITIELTELDVIPVMFPSSPDDPVPGPIAAAARGTLRLRRGGQIATFYTQVEDTHHCFDPNDINDCVRWGFSSEIGDIQDALLAELVGGKDGILDTFFGDECPNGDCSLVVTTKLVEESAEINACVVPVVDPPPNDPCEGGPKSLLLVADIVLAVK